MGSPGAPSGGQGKNYDRAYPTSQSPPWSFLKPITQLTGGLSVWQHCESRSLLNPEVFVQSSSLDPNTILLPAAWWDLRDVCFSRPPPGTPAILTLPPPRPTTDAGGLRLFPPSP